MRDKVPVRWKKVLSVMCSVLIWVTSIGYAGEIGGDNSGGGSGGGVSGGGGFTFGLKQQGYRFTIVDRAGGQVSRSVDILKSASRHADAKKGEYYTGYRGKASSKGGNHVAMTTGMLGNIIPANVDSVWPVSQSGSSFVGNGERFYVWFLTGSTTGSITNGSLGSRKIVTGGNGNTSKTKNGNQITQGTKSGGTKTQTPTQTKYKLPGVSSFYNSAGRLQAISLASKETNYMGGGAINQGAILGVYRQNYGRGPDEAYRAAVNAMYGQLVRTGMSDAQKAIAIAEAVGQMFGQDSSPKNHKRPSGTKVSYEGGMSIGRLGEMSGGSMMKLGKEEKSAKSEKGLLSGLWVTEVYADEKEGVLPYDKILNAKSGGGFLFAPIGGAMVVDPEVWDAKKVEIKKQILGEGGETVKEFSLSNAKRNELYAAYNVAYKELKSAGNLVPAEITEGSIIAMMKKYDLAVYVEPVFSILYNQEF